VQLMVPEAIAVTPGEQKKITARDGLPCCTVVYDSSCNVAARCHRANKKASLPNYLLCFYALVQSWPSFSCARLPFGMRHHPRVAGKSRRALGRQVVIYPGPWAQAPSSQCFRVLTSRNVAQGGPDAPSFTACLCPVQGAILCARQFMCHGIDNFARFGASSRRFLSPL